MDWSMDTERRINLWPVALVLLLGLTISLAWWITHLTNSQGQIVGLWQLPNGWTLQFLPSGDFVGTSAQGVAIRGSYEWVDDEHMKLEITSPSPSSEIRQVMVNGITATTTGQVSGVQQWMRVERRQSQREMPL